MTNASGKNSSPGAAGLRAIRERLELPAVSGPRWLRWVLVLRWLVVPAILAVVLSTGGVGVGRGVPGGRGSRGGPRDRQPHRLDDDRT